MTVPVAAAAARAAGGRTAAAGAGRAGAGRAGAAKGAARPAPPKRARSPKPALATKAPTFATADELADAVEAPADPPAGDAGDAPPSSTSTRRSSSRQAPDVLSNQAGAPSWYRKTVDGDPVRAANAGGGFLLGLGLYAIGLTYLKGGRPAVKALLKAKFFNQVSA